MKRTLNEQSLIQHLLTELANSRQNHNKPHRHLWPRWHQWYQWEHGNQERGCPQIARREVGPTRGRMGFGTASQYAGQQKAQRANELTVLRADRTNAFPIRLTKRISSLNSQLLFYMRRTKHSPIQSHTGNGRRSSCTVPSRPTGAEAGTGQSKERASAIGNLNLCLTKGPTAKLSSASQKWRRRIHTPCIWLQRQSAVCAEQESNNKVEVVAYGAPIKSFDRMKRSHNRPNPRRSPVECSRNPEVGKKRSVEVVLPNMSASFDSVHMEAEVALLQSPRLHSHMPSAMTNRWVPNYRERSSRDSQPFTHGSTGC